MFRALLAASLLLLPSGSPLAATSVQGEEQARFEQGVRGQLRRHRHLARVPLEWVRTHPPFLFLVQKPDGAPEAYVGEVVARRLEWLNGLHGSFRADFAEPMGLRLRADRRQLVVVILEDEVELSDCLRAVGEELALGGPAWYDAANQFLLLREPAPETPIDSHLVLHQAAHLLVQGHGPSVEGTPGPFWLWEGLADDLAAHRELEVRALRERKLALPALDRLVEVLQSPGARQCYLLSLESFLRQSDFDSVISSCTRGAIGGFSVDERVAASTYVAMASAFVHYLAFEAPEPIPELMREYTERAIKNRLGEKPLAEYLGDVDLAELEWSFWQYVWRTAREERPRTSLDSGHLRDFLAARGLTEAAGEGAAAAGPARLFETLLDPDARLALAIAQARAGDPEAALRLLDGALAIGPPAEAAQRVERERQRLRAWIEVRDGFLAHLVTSGKKFSFEHEGKKLTAKLAEVKEGRVHFEKNRRGVESLAFAELDPVELARRMRDRKWGFEAGWAAAYPCVLANDPKVKRLLRGEEPEVVALAGDVESDYPKRWEAIGVAELLIELSAAASEESAEAAPRALELIGELWSQKEKVSFIAALGGDLETLAEQLLGAQFEAGGVETALAGAVQTREDGRLAVSYDFADEKQLGDWQLEETPGRRHAGYGELQSESSSFGCENGKLIGIGQTSLTHRLQFEGPQSIACKCRMLGGDMAEQQLELSFEVSLCNGPRMARIGMVNALGLDVVDAKTGALNRQKPDEVKIHFDVVYELRLEHDGRNQVKFLRGGDEVFSDSCHRNVRGAVVLFVHSDYAIEFDDVEIIGTPLETSVRALRDAWVAGRLAELGF